MTSFAPRAAPPYAVLAWVDGNNLYVELPCKDQAPYIQKLPKDGVGFAKALSLMAGRFAIAEPASPTYLVPKHPLVKRKAGADFTEEQRENARAVLKRLKIT